MCMIHKLGDSDTFFYLMTPKPTIGRPPHNRRLGLSGVSLTKARLPRDDIKAGGEVRNELENLIIDSGYLDGAPFHWVTIIIRYGLINEREPHYQRINRKYGDLPLAIEVDTHEMLGASFEALQRVYRRAVLLALIHAGHKYERPVRLLDVALQAMQPDEQQPNVA